MLASFGSYALEKKLAKDPSRFGKGAIQGVAGPESANNAGAQTSFIPLLTLGIPEKGDPGLPVQPIPTAVLATPNGEVAVFLAPWSHEASAVEVVARAGGSLVAVGRPWAAVAVSEDPDFVTHLYEAGAFLVTDDPGLGIKKAFYFQKGAGPAAFIA